LGAQKHGFLGQFGGMKLKADLEFLHKLISSVAGEVCIAIASQRVHGGMSALERWANNLRVAADLVDKMIDKLKASK